MKSREAIQAINKKIPGDPTLYVQRVEKNGLEELATEIEKRLPGTSVDRSLLGATYEFELKGQRLTVGNDEFFAVGVKRNGPPYYLPKIVVQEAETILKSSTFLRDVAQKAYMRAV